MYRYNKYLVIKNSDIASFLNDYQKQTLEHLTNSIQNGRLSRGKAPQSYVCIAADWPMYEQVWSMIEAFVDGKPNEIEQLTARVRELEEENARLMFALADTEALKLGTSERLAASQAYAEQLREALEKTRGALAYVKVNGRDNPNLMESTAWHGLAATDKALALPNDTSALDAYVAEKVKEAMK